MLDVSPLETLIGALSNQDVLLILDNCEHLIGACSKFADEVLRNCAHVHILATSREPLGIEGERVYRVPSMSLPGDEVETLADVGSSDAVAAVPRPGPRGRFRGARRRRGAGFIDLRAPRRHPAGARVGRRPTLVDVAVPAPRTTRPALSAPHRRESQRDGAPTDPSGARRLVLRSAQSRGAERAASTLGLRRWLHPRGRRVGRARTTLVDEFDVANVLHSLVAKSLVVADRGVGSVRFRLLETIRQYSAQKLLDTEGDEVTLDVRDRHADFYVALALSGGEGYYSPRHIRMGEDAGRRR